MQLTFLCKSRCGRWVDLSPNWLFRSQNESMHARLLNFCNTYSEDLRACFEGSQVGFCPFLARCQFLELGSLNSAVDRTRAEKLSSLCGSPFVRQCAAEALILICGNRVQDKALSLYTYIFRFMYYCGYRTVVYAIKAETAQSTMHVLTRAHH